MTDKESIYIKCLKKGDECGLTGITYWEMIDYLTPFGIPAKEYDFHVYFFKWFFDNFHQQIVTDSRIRDLKIVFHPHWMERGNNGQLDLKAVMTFEAQEKYLNYLSLKSSDRKSNLANNLAWSAIGISVLLSAVQIFFSIRQDNYNHRQEEIQTNMRQKTNQVGQSQKKYSMFSLPSITDSTIRAEHLKNDTTN